ncbi:MAG: L,D-transpeptidase family protein [Polyangiaceae bacterium]
MKVIPRRRSITMAVAVLALLGCGKRKQDSSPALWVATSSSTSTGQASLPPPPTSSAEADAQADNALPPASSGGAVVELDGSYHPAPPIPDGAPRIAARALQVPVFARPSEASKRIGTLRAGAIVEADASDMGKDGCPGGWRGIKPAGFVCLGDKATTDLDDPLVRAMSRGPDRSQRLPYMYGTVTRGGPAYSRIPTEDEIRKFEPGLKKHIQKWKTDPVSGAEYGYELWFKWKSPPTGTAWQAWEDRVTDTDIPFYLQNGGSLPTLPGTTKPDSVKIDQVDRKQGAAFIESFLYEGRRYNVTTDMRLIPADRYRPIRGSDYHGVRIGVDVDFPFALIRKKGAKRYLWSASKKKMVEDEDLDYRAFVALTGKQKMVGGVLHYETKDGFWVDDRHASRLDPAKRMPKWGTNGERWIDVNITKQTLVAFDGTKAVYATLVSTGEDGLSEGGKATKKGIFRIHTKYVSTTMDSDIVGEEFELRDVPYVQYFEGGLAIHGAYWHDGFGTPKSHGCINLAPEDARRLFYFTEPQVPFGWHGAAKPLTGTVVFVHP